MTSTTVAPTTAPTSTTPPPTTAQATSPPSTVPAPPPSTAPAPLVPEFEFDWYAVEYPNPAPVDIQEFSITVRLVIRQGDDVVYESTRKTGAWATGGAIIVFPETPLGELHYVVECGQDSCSRYSA
jgi:hypothetical protein